jgi:hypothetical protein
MGHRPGLRDLTVSNKSKGKQSREAKLRGPLHSPRQHPTDPAALVVPGHHLALELRFRIHQPKSET